MIIAIEPLEQWTGRIYPEHVTYMDVPSNINVDAELQKCYCGENPAILIQHFLNLGATIIPDPIRRIGV